jgi:hypothetical protein
MILLITSIAQSIYSSNSINNHTPRLHEDTEQTYFTNARHVVLKGSRNYTCDEVLFRIQVEVTNQKAINSEVTSVYKIFSGI